MNILKTGSGRIYPSLIAADLLNLEHQIRMLDTHVDGYHIDIMDGHFVPNLTWGTMFVDAFCKVTKKPLWIHLMVDNPLWWIKELQLPYGSTVSFHIESTSKVERCINSIKEKKCRPSLAVSPKTPISETFSFFYSLDHILVMSVEPGFSGQPFISAMEQKLYLANDAFHEMGFAKEREKRRLTIAFDGGINMQNIENLFHQGATDFAVASAIFASNDILDAVVCLKKLIV